jgi:hypothetical protein
MIKKINWQHSAPGVETVKNTKGEGKNTKSANNSLGRKRSFKEKAIENTKEIADEKLIKVLGYRRRKVSVYTSRKLFFENNNENAALSKHYFRNYYNSINRKGRKNLQRFFQGLNDKSILGVSEILEDEDQHKYLTVKYKTDGGTSIGYVWYMPGMNKLIEIASKVDFKLDLNEILKESYI